MSSPHNKSVLSVCVQIILKLFKSCKLFPAILRGCSTSACALQVVQPGTVDSKSKIESEWPAQYEIIWQATMPCSRDAHAPQRRTATLEWEVKCLLYACRVYCLLAKVENRAINCQKVCISDNLHDLGVS